MQSHRILQATLLSLCFLATTTVGSAQTATQVIYTGKLMGYFRTPDVQPRNNNQGCSASNKSSAAADSFKRIRDLNPNAVLVGSGDNFAPELEARVFKNDANSDTTKARPNQTKAPVAKYQPENKELYYWSEKDNDWIFFENIDDPKYRDLKATLALGRATIPTDNVGCFLAGAKFAAVVPGKHDFYFGPERVRELARFMASLSYKKMQGYGFDDKYRPPQMLGANLVIKTSQTAPPSPATSKAKSKWPEETAIKNLGDGNSLYPWFSSIVRVQLPAPSSKSMQASLKEKFRLNEYVDQQPFEVFLNDRIKVSSDVDRAAWTSLQGSLGNQTNVWICPPPNADSRCEGGWQIGKTEVTTSVLAPASENVLTQIRDWFTANEKFDRIAFQTFLSNNANAAHGNYKDLRHNLPEKDAWRMLSDKEAWQKLSVGFEQLNAEEIRVCPTSKLNEVAAGCKQGWLVQDLGLAQDDNGIFLSIRVVPNGHQPPPHNRQTYQPIQTLEPGWSYGLCKVNNGSAKEDIETQCQTFSVLTPFFSFAHTVSTTGPDYKDPEPFVLIQPDKDPKHDVAIFGVVDPNITQHIGVLNYSWLNDEKKLRTVVSAEDPAEALKEQLDYFNLYYQTANQHEFQGLKILVAQMSPPQAKLLAARFKKFQLVVTEADQEQATSEAALSTEWRQDAPGNAFMAVPAPYYVRGQKEAIEGAVHFGMVNAIPNDSADRWTVSSMSLTPVEVAGKSIKDDDLARILLTSLNTCDPLSLPDYDHLPKASDVIKWATLCAMRDRLHADVALIQKRDLFDRVPVSADPNEIQQLLDRLLWKGDLLTLMYVPGGALKKTLALSKKFDNDDSDNLSLSDEKLRGLEYLGIKKNEKGDYLINEAPLDDNKVYSVATTDYIGAGDTGYPDLAAATLDPKTYSRQFPDQLELISAVVCRNHPLGTTVKCISEIARQKYLDEIADTPPFPRKPGFMDKLSYLNPFKGPDKTPWKATLGDVLDKNVQQRPIWMVKLNNFSLSFSGLTNNDTNANIEDKYAGIADSGISALKNHSIVVGLDLQAVRSEHNYDLFANTGIDYDAKATGVPHTTPTVVQNSNRLTFDVGILGNLNGRGAFRWGPIFTLHTETQLAQPFNVFKLGTSVKIDNDDVTDRLKIPQKRSVQLIPRVGVKHQNRTNLAEFGFEKGREFGVLEGYEFPGDTGPACKANARESLADCIKAKSKENPPAVTKDSQAIPLYQDRPRTGFYWKWNISIPFHEKVKFDLSDEGDLFFADITHDLSTDTRFRDLSKGSLKFMIFPSFSIGPSLRLLLYRNQTALDPDPAHAGEKLGGKFLSQKTFGLEASFSFNWFNRREASSQFKHKP